MALAEVLLAIVIFSFVLMATLSVLDAGGKIAPKDQERSQVLRESQVGLDRMVRELREAYRVLSTSPSSMEALVRIRKDDPATTAVESHVDRRVQYDCGLSEEGRCLRREAPLGQVLPGAGDVVIDRVLNWDYDEADAGDRPVFSYSQSSDPIRPTYVTVRIETPAKGERKAGHAHSVVLEDGFYARNLRIGG